MSILINLLLFLYKHNLKIKFAFYYAIQKTFFVYIHSNPCSVHINMHFISKPDTNFQFICQAKSHENHWTFDLIMELLFAWIVLRA